MVGYKGEEISEAHKLVAGAFAGCLSRFLTQPLDVIKVRWQLHKKRAGKNFTVLSVGGSILRKEGVPAFWQGHTLGQLHSILAVGSQFYVYEVLSKQLSLHGYDTRRSGTQMACGATAGCLSCVLVNPMEVIRVRQMIAGDRYRRLVAGARLVYSLGGVRAFYEGLAASLLQIAPAAGISFAVFGMVQPLLLEQLRVDSGGGGAGAGGGVGASVVDTDTKDSSSAVNLLVASVGAGAAAGIVSKTVVYPLDLVKRRLQIGSHVEETQNGEWWQAGRGGAKKTLVSCDHLATCLWNAYQREGVAGLYRGWRITMLKAQLTSALVFGSYELARRVAANAESK